MIEQLPSHCYSSQKRMVSGLVIHYFSAIIADPENWANPQRILELLWDMNLPAEQRIFGPWQGLRKERYYASYDSLIFGNGLILEPVPKGQKTWHAGASMHFTKELGWREDCNSYMAGVALIAAPQVSAEYSFREGHYMSLAKVLQPYSDEMITTHEQVRFNYLQKHPESDAIKKKDPGPDFSRDRLIAYRDHDLGTG